MTYTVPMHKGGGEEGLDEAEWVREGGRGEGERGTREDARRRRAREARRIRRGMDRFRFSCSVDVRRSAIALFSLSLIAQLGVVGR